MKDLILIPDLGVLKNECKNVKRKQFNRLLDEVNRYLNIDIPANPPAQSTTFIGISIMNLALAYLLTDDERYLNKASRYMSTVCDYEYWGNAHLVNVDLSASWILFGLSLGYNWLFDKLKIDEKKKILSKLKYQADIMLDYKQKTVGNGWSTNYWQNHNWINMTGLACCGYAIAKEYPKALEYIKEAKANFTKVFECLADDGSNYEGVTYWRYGGMWLFVYADMLNNREGINWFLKSNYLKNTFYYRLYQSASILNRQLNFGDCHDRYSSHSIAVYYKYASMYNDGYAQTLGNLVLDKYLYEEQYQSKLKPGILFEAGFELLWYDANVLEKSLEELPLVRKFDDLGLVCIRNGFDEGSSVFSFKCGYPGGRKQWLLGWEEYYKNKQKCLALSHNHPDNLSYILTKGHEYLVIDDGYNRNIKPYDHNSLLVDGWLCDANDVSDVYMSSANLRMNHNEFDYKDYYGNLTYFYNVRRMTMLQGDNTKIYPISLKMKCVKRSIFTDDLKYIVIINDFDSFKEHRYESIVNTDVKGVDLSLNTLGFNIGSEHFKHYIFAKDIAHTQFNHEVSSVMTTQEPDKKCVTKMECVSYYNANKVKEYRQIEVIDLNDIDVKYNDNILNVDDKIILFSNQMNFEFDGDYLILDKAGNEIILVNGTIAKYKNKEVIKEREKGCYTGELNEIFE